VLVLPSVGFDRVFICLRLELLPNSLDYEKVITMASLIAILDLKGKPLIQRSYRDDVPPSYIERFLPLILELEEQDKQVTPCFTDQGINYMHIRHSNLYCRS